MDKSLVQLTNYIYCWFGFSPVNRKVQLIEISLKSLLVL